MMDGAAQTEHFENDRLEELKLSKSLAAAIDRLVEVSGETSLLSLKKNIKTETHPFTIESTLSVHQQTHAVQSATALSHANTLDAAGKILEASFDAYLQTDWHQDVFSSPSEVSVPVSETCATCSGKGRVACKPCASSGNVPCTNRECRHGQVACSRCNGGKRRCDQCGGGGYVKQQTTTMIQLPKGGFEQKTEERTLPCTYCSGSGYAGACYSCHGVNRETCGVCSGRQFVVCSTCEGSGDNNCTHCIDGTRYTHLTQIRKISRNDRRSTEDVQRFETLSKIAPGFLKSKDARTVRNYVGSNDNASGRMRYDARAHAAVVAQGELCAAIGDAKHPAFFSAEIKRQASRKSFAALKARNFSGLTKTPYGQLILKAVKGEHSAKDADEILFLDPDDIFQSEVKAARSEIEALAARGSTIWRIVIWLVAALTPFAAFEMNVWLLAWENTIHYSQDLVLLAMLAPLSIWVLYGIYFRIRSRRVMKHARISGRAKVNLKKAHTLLIALGVNLLSYAAIHEGTITKHLEAFGNRHGYPLEFFPPCTGVASEKAHCVVKRTFMPTYSIRSNLIALGRDL